MPNWVTHRVNVTGPEEQIKAFRKRMFNKNDAFDFEGLVPMPKELLDIEVGSTSSEVHATLSGQYAVHGRTLIPESHQGNLEQAKSWLRENNPHLLEQLELTQKVKRETGYNSWYDWAHDNWGTKWPACHGGIDTDDPGELEFTFDTPWGVPEPFFDTVGEAFPALSFQVSAFDEGWCFGARGSRSPTEGGSGTAFYWESVSDDEMPALYETVFGAEPELEEED